MTLNLYNYQLSELVAERPSRARVLEWFGLDYCCQGKRSLQAACEEQNLDLQMVMKEIIISDRANNHREERNWINTNAAELIHHIVEVHHSYLRAEIPRLSVLTDKVASVHKDRHPELSELRDLFSEVRKEIMGHLDAEEKVLFPAIRAAMIPTNREGNLPRINKSLVEMEKDHLALGELLGKMRTISKNYQLPPDGCETYRVMLHSLIALEEDLHIHIHKENYILFAKVRE